MCYRLMIQWNWDEGIVHSETDEAVLAHVRRRCVVLADLLAKGKDGHVIEETVKF